MTYKLHRALIRDQEIINYNYGTHRISLLGGVATLKQSGDSIRNDHSTESLGQKFLDINFLQSSPKRHIL